MGGSSPPPARGPAGNLIASTGQGGGRARLGDSDRVEASNSPTGNTAGSHSKATLTFDEKKRIQTIVSGFLRPALVRKEISDEQYTTINRKVSRKLYEHVATVSEEIEQTLEIKANEEVERELSRVGRSES